jgi:hypothetical protein
MEIVPPYCGYKPEPVLESAEQILHWDTSTVTDKTTDCNRPDAVFTDRQTDRIRQQFLQIIQKFP